MKYGVDGMVTINLYSWVSQKNAPQGLTKTLGRIALRYSLCIAFYDKAN